MGFYHDDEDYREDDDADCMVYADSDESKEDIDDEIWRGYMRQIGFNNW